MKFKDYILEHHPDPDSVFGIDNYNFEQIVVLAENYAKDYHAKQSSIFGVVQAKPDKVCELVREEFDGWIFGIETQAGEKLKVVDSSDFSEIITELESKLSKL